MCNENVGEDDEDKDDKLSLKSDNIHLTNFMQALFDKEPKAVKDDDNYLSTLNNLLFRNFNAVHREAEVS